MKSEGNKRKESSEERPFTFKITKRRSPWTKEEDDGITALVNKYGTGNWTLIANEMSNLYGFRNRSGKQCRERWHNHLDPNINKDYWTEKEENVLFLKHMEYGNKWSDIAKFLPGRTDNAIKNHFYSKLRKFIRKILKQINKDNLLKSNGIDPNKYNSDKVYKMIKKYKLAYNTLNKDSIMNMIINYERNNKGTRGDLGAGGGLLKNKTQRGKRETSGTHYQKENLYSLRINKRAKKNYEDSQLYPLAVTTRSRTRGGNWNNKFEEANERKRKTAKKTATSTRSRRVITTKKRAKEYEYDYYDEEEDEEIEENEDEEYMIDNFGFSKKNEQKTKKEEENFNFHLSHNRPLQSFFSQNANDENGHELVKRNLNIIINKSLLFNKYLKEEEEKSKSISENKSADEKLFQAVPSIENQNQNLPLVSPINPITKIYPSSARNLFNIDMSAIQQGSETAYQSPVLQTSNNLLINPSYPGVYPTPGIEGFNTMQFYNSLQNFVNLTALAQTTQNQFLYRSYPTEAQFVHAPNKEINLHNKILINERTASSGNMADQTSEAREEIKEERNIYNHPQAVAEEIPKTENDDIAARTVHEQLSEPLLCHTEPCTSAKFCVKRPSIDLNVVSQSETNKIFSVNNIDQERHNASTEVNFTNRTILTPTAASLSISPKSAFAKYSKEA